MLMCVEANVSKTRRRPRKLECRASLEPSRPSIVLYIHSTGLCTYENSIYTHLMVNKDEKEVEKRSREDPRGKRREVKMLNAGPRDCKSGQIDRKSVGLSRSSAFAPRTHTSLHTFV